jgi:quercetin dioxygenase-like cupin family protein
MTVRPVVTNQGEGRAIWHGDALWQFKATSEDTDGRFFLAELQAAEGWASPVHLHTKEDETFIVLEGELWVQIAGEDHKVPAGAVAVMPRGIPHAYRVVSPTARFLALGVPGGFECWFIETGEPAGSLTLPPPATEQPDYAAYVASLSRYGVQFIAPPPLPS